MSLYGRIFPIEQLPTDKPSLDEMIDTLPFGLEETKRLRSIRNETALRQSLAAWLSLRDLAVHCALPDPLTVLRTDLGKPYFAEPSLPSFSLSHTDTLSVALLNTDGSVGVDIESLKKNRSKKELEKIALRFFSKTEQMLLKDADDPFAVFMQIWTKKEAFSKLTGEGLGAVIGQKTSSQKISIQRFSLQMEFKRFYLTVATDPSTAPIQWIGITDPIQIREI